jgi:alpha-L-rhamnosidase
MFLFDVAALYAKWVTDMEDGQDGKGRIPEMAPGGGYNDSVTWASTFLFVPLNLLEQYDDTALLARYYPSMAKWTDHMAEYIKDGLTSRDNYGDWCVPKVLRGKNYVNDPTRKTAPTILATTYFYECLRIMKRFATLVNKPEDAARYGDLANQLKTALNQTQYNKEKGYFDNGSQTATILPLAFDMVPEGERARVIDHLVSKIEKESDGHLATGLVGTQWLCKALTEGGRPDLMYRIASNKTYPSWGYMVEKGATTIWELWNGDTAGGGMNSHNHVMMVGDLIIWLYEDLAGIRTDPERRGFKKIQIKPLPVGDLTWVKASYESLHGRIATHWKRENGRFSLEVTIPANTTAEVYVPAKDPSVVTESGIPIAKAKAVKFLRMQDTAGVYAIGSGTYRFESSFPESAK